MSLFSPGVVLFRNVFKNSRLQFDFSYRCLSDVLFNKNLDLNTKREIEKKWSTSVDKGSFDENKDDKFYILSMFPYPSGNLHMGHVRVYTISDVLARFHRMNGKNVLHPMGFDAFGLPAENAAAERNIDPKEWTYSNIASMKKQLESLGFSFDWDRELTTCSEDYYKFTQYIFLLLYKSGLVYQKEALVNWDPVDKTVLADEQVDSSGKSWRSGATVEKKTLKQWFVKTSLFARSLLKGLSDPNLQDWRDITKLQEHWIGDCDGARFTFRLVINEQTKEDVSVWIRYPEHITEAAFVTLSPSSVLGLKYSGKNNKIVAFNPFNKKYVPVFITDEIEFDEGCDVKIGLPSFDENHKSFAQKNDIPFEEKELYYDYERRTLICDFAQEANIGGYFVSSKLRDWLISRQRKWGTPIPIVHCDNCGVVPVDFEDLPVKITATKDTTCPSCHRPATRETDTMDTFVDSSWYFLRYTDPNNSTEPFCRSKVNSLMPVDIYVGGKEHAVLHLYYARFICHFLHSINLLDHPEPFTRLLVQGMVMSKTYYVEETGKCVRKEDVVKKENEFFEKSSGLKVVEVWEKMSKSKYNGIEPGNIIEEYGIDTTRLLVLSEVAPTSHRHWDSDKFPGVLNWQQRLWTLVYDFYEARKSPDDHEKSSKSPDLWDARNFYIKGTTFNYTVTHQLSIVISKLQGLTNSLKKCDKRIMATSEMFERCLGELLIMLYPMAPHFTSELWEILQKTQNRIDVDGKYFDWDSPVYKQRWPVLDNEYRLELICKVNNAVKAKIKVPFSDFKCLDKPTAFRIALSEPKVSSFIESCDILDKDFLYNDNYEATLNILIDHWQKRKTKLKSSESV